MLKHRAPCRHGSGVHWSVSISHLQIHNIISQPIHTKFLHFFRPNKEGSKHIDREPTNWSLMKSDIYSKLMTLNSPIFLCRGLLNTLGLYAFWLIWLCQKWAYMIIICRRRRRRRRWCCWCLRLWTVHLLIFKMAAYDRSTMVAIWRQLIANTCNCCDLLWDSSPVNFQNGCLW